jgi:hypothetical protein
MLDPKRVEPTITTPTEQEQEAITGGALVFMNTTPARNGWTIDPELCHEPTKPKWDPGGPPQRRPF